MSVRLAAVLVICVAASPAAVQTPLTPRAINEAISIGQSGVERDRMRFHLPYRVSVARPPVDFIDVITSFRRVVLIAEERTRIGDRSFGQRQALELGIAEEIELRVELTFHPLNTYIGVPAYEVTLSGPGSSRIEPRTFDRIPRYGPRVEGAPLIVGPVPGGPVLPRGSQPVLGGTVTARFDLKMLSSSALYDVSVAEGEKELARAKVDLARLR